MYERFTDRTRKVLQLANQEAQRLCHEYIGTEHVLLGLIKESEGVAAQVLRSLNIDLRRVQVEVEKIVLPGIAPIADRDLPLTARTERVIDYAYEESRRRNCPYLGTEHILLGLLRDEEGVAGHVLANFGVQHDAMRAIVHDFLAGSRQEAVDSAEELLRRADKAIAHEHELALSRLPATLREQVHTLTIRIDEIKLAKEEAVAAQDFFTAANLRHEQDRLHKQRERLLRERGRRT